MRIVGARVWGILLTALLLETPAPAAQAQSGAASARGICGAPTQRILRFTVPLLTEHFFIAGRRADGGAWSWGFNYPSTWRVTTNPPNVNQVDIVNVGLEVLVTPDPHGITHGYRLLPPLRRRLVAPEEAITSYTQSKFQDFRVRGRMDVPGMNVPGYQAATITLFYHARYRGRPVEGILTTEVLSFYEPMLGGLVTILAFTAAQIAADLPAAECYEKLNGLIGIALSARNVREIGNWREARGWINTLGGLTEARDPRTGETFLVPFAYRYWWRDGTTLLGTNDPTPQSGALLELPTGGPFPRP